MDILPHLDLRWWPAPTRNKLYGCNSQKISLTTGDHWPYLGCSEIFSLTLYEFWERNAGKVLGSNCEAFLFQQGFDTAMAEINLCCSEFLFRFSLSFLFLFGLLWRYFLRENFLHTLPSNGGSRTIIRITSLFCHFRRADLTLLTSWIPKKEIFQWSQKEP